MSYTPLLTLVQLYILKINRMQQVDALNSVIFDRIVADTLPAYTSCNLAHVLR